jgi:hypothetical protein
VDEFVDIICLTPLIAHIQNLRTLTLHAFDFRAGFICKHEPHGQIRQHRIVTPIRAVEVWCKLNLLMIEIRRNKMSSVIDRCILARPPRLNALTSGFWKNDFGPSFIPLRLVSLL